MKLTSILFPGVMLAIALVYEIMALNMPRGTIRYPGPGFFPMVVGIFLIATVAGTLIQEILKRKPAKPSSGSQTASEAAISSGYFGKTFQLFALMIGYILALPHIGFPVAICIFMLISIRIFGSRHWVPALVLAVAISAFSYISFVLWLKVPLPLGILEKFLG